MSALKIKGISYRFNDMFYVDVEPNTSIKSALDDAIQKQNISLTDDNYLCGINFLNVACDIERGSFGLLTWMSDWIDIPYEFTKTEKREIVEFINKWKGKIPTNVDGYKYADDTEYVWALSDDIPWKAKVLR